MSQPEQAHIARVEYEASRCDPGAFWSVPLITANEWAYATCLRCRSLTDGT